MGVRVNGTRSDRDLPKRVTSCRHHLAMSTGRLKRKLGDLGVDTSSRKANESFCLVSMFSSCHPSCTHFLDWYSLAAIGEIQGHWRICAAMEARRP